MFNRKSAFAAALIALGTVAAGSAHASNVQWSVGINLPQVGTVISNAPVYQPYYEPAPVYVRPAPVVVYQPAPPVIYRPAPVVVYRPAPVYGPGYYGPGVIRSGWAVPSRHRHGHYDRDDRRDDRRDGRRDEYGDSNRGDRWSAEPRRQHH
jgi:hypothetical protein